MEIGNMQNIDNSRLNMAGINSKNYSQEMEGKVNNIKSKGSFLKFNDLEGNENNNDRGSYLSKRMKSMESKISQRHLSKEIKSSNLNSNKDVVGKIHKEEDNKKNEEEDNKENKEEEDNKENKEEDNNNNDEENKINFDWILFIEG